MAKFLDFAKENSDGWSLVAVQAALEGVVAAITNNDSTIKHTEDVPIRVMVDSKDEDGNYISFTPTPKERTFFALATAKRKWCIIYRTLYWCETVDSQWVASSAGLLSATLHCEAIASCGGGHGFATQMFNDGEPSSELPPYDHNRIAKEFNARKIELPLCFIGGTSVELFVDQSDADTIERADRFECQL